jgi:hypothetical protein
MKKVEQDDPMKLIMYEQQMTSIFNAASACTRNNSNSVNLAVFLAQGFKFGTGSHDLITDYEKIKQLGHSQPEKIINSRSDRQFSGYGQYERNKSKITRRQYEQRIFDDFQYKTKKRTRTQTDTPRTIGFYQPKKLVYYQEYDPEDAIISYDPDNPYINRETVVRTKIKKTTTITTQISPSKKRRPETGQTTDKKKRTKRIDNEEFRKLNQHLFE